MKNTLILKASGDSMEPLIKHGAKIIISLTGKKYSFGDIVIFNNHSKLCAHRIINIKYSHTDTWFFMKGDNNTFYDGWVPKANVLGRVEGIQYRTYEINLNSVTNKLLMYIFMAYSASVLTFPVFRDLKKIGKNQIVRSIYRGLLMR